MMFLALEARSIQPSLMFFTSKLSDVGAANNVILRRIKVVQSNEHKEKICCNILFNLLIQHPFLPSTLSSLDLYPNTLCSIRI